MSAWKPLAVGITIWGLTASAAHADPISWPSGLNDWMIYLAAPTGASVSTPPVSYHVVASQPAPPQPIPASPAQPTPLQPSASGPVNTVANTPWVVIPPTPGVVSTPSPAMTVAAPAAASAASQVDGYINLGTGPYPLAGLITTGGAQPWYQSSQIASLFGGQPTAQQIQSFDSAILQRVQQTFSQSGVSVTLTDNPNVPALHTISLVSGTASASLASAIGMTQVGQNGFSFIDKIAPSAQSLDQLEWIVAHNISHEMMLAFGVPENYDQTGNYIDSKMANWSMMVNPAATFSPAAAQAISQALAIQNDSSASYQLGAQEFGPAAVPEPATMALWAAGAAAALVIARLRNRSRCRAELAAL